MQYLACSCTSSVLEQEYGRGLWNTLGEKGDWYYIIRGRVGARPTRLDAEEESSGPSMAYRRLYPGKSSPLQPGAKASPLFSESRCLDPGVLCNMGGAAGLPLVRRARCLVIGDKPQERKQSPIALSARHRARRMMCLFGWVCQATSL